MYFVLMHMNRIYNFMSVKSHIPFYRQMSGILIFLFCLLFLMSSVAGFLLYQRNAQVNNLVHNQIPKIEFTNKVNLLLQRNSSLTDALSKSTSLDELADIFQKIHSNTNKISTLYRNQNDKVNTLKIEINNVNETLKRIGGNNKVNERLKRAAVDQVDTLNKILIKEIEDTTKEQASLRRLVNDSGAYVYAGQANAYIDSIKTVIELNQIKELLESASIELIKLNLSMPLEHLDKLTSKIDLAMQKWLSILTSIRTDLDIKNRIQGLDNFLNTEERVLSKWHSHLRLAQELFERMKLINDELKTISSTDNYSTLNNENISVLPPIMNKMDVEISLKHFNVVLIVIFTTIFLLITFLLFNIHRKLKKHGSNTIKLCDNLLLSSESGNGIDNVVQSAEHLKMLSLVQYTQLSEFTENEPSSVIETNSKISAFITDHHRIIHWQYIPEELYIIDNVELLELCRVSNQHISSWRYLFTKESIKNIVSIAKNVRDSGATLSCIVNSHSGARMDLLIDYDGREWSGTLHRNDKIELLKNTLAQVKQKLKYAEADVHEEITATTERFSKMTLGAMLQSQSGSIDSIGASIPVYRQLSRVFDWCRQSSIVTELKHEEKQSLKSNINFKNELHAIVFNAMPDAYIQRNNIYLQTDRLLMTFAQIDQRLFNRMLLGLIRITMAELFNAKLLLNLKVVDLDTGMQTVKFTLSVKTAKPLEAIPELVKRLANENRGSAASLDIIFYLRTLMYHLNIQDVHTVLNEQGFSLFFDAQLIEGQEIGNTNTVLPNVSLKGTHTLLLSDCEYVQTVVTDAIYGIGGDLTLLVNYAVLASNYSQEVIEKEGVNLIVVGEDVFKEDIDKVYAFVATLPESIQPKVCVMQAAINSPLHEVGLYGQAATPICQKSFQSELANLIESDKKNNNLLDAQALSRFEYLPTRVEVLLAVTNPEVHQTFIRILNWLGLQVQVVTQPQSMLKSWQSGRYLVLFSEFSHSPFMMMGTGRNIQRGVFTFTDMLFDTPSDVVSKATKQWKVSKLPNILDIQSLTDLLKPWLKINTAIVTNQISEINKVSTIKKAKPLSIPVNEDETKLNDYEKAYLHQAEILSEDRTVLSNDAICDLSQYAENQGSFELAIYMLDDYIDDIKNGMTLIEESLDGNKLTETIPLFTSILKAVDVLSASDMNKSVHALKLNIENCIASGEQDANTPLLLKNVKDECERLVEFTESI